MICASPRNRCTRFAPRGIGMLQAMIQTATVTIEELLEHSSWVRSLARQLVSDSSIADDLAQEAWVAALRRPPLRGVPLRPFWNRVARGGLP